jgi:hypothetical protein
VAASWKTMRRVSDASARSIAEIADEDGVHWLDRTLGHWLHVGRLLYSRSELPSSFSSRHTFVAACPLVCFFFHESVRMILGGRVLFGGSSFRFPLR